jgi:hypothetical protein
MLYIFQFQVHDYSNNTNFPLTASEGVVDLRPAVGNLISLEVSSDMQTSGQYWIIGTYNGVDGLDGIDISNTIVSNFNKDNLCGTTQKIQL